jgi:hypothetical protein
LGINEKLRKGLPIERTFAFGASEIPLEASGARGVAGFLASEGSLGVDAREPEAAVVSRLRAFVGIYVFQNGQQTCTR